MKVYDLQLALHNPEKVTELYLHNKKLEVDGFNDKKITQFVNRKVKSEKQKSPIANTIGLF